MTLAPVEPTHPLLCVEVVGSSILSICSEFQILGYTDVDCQFHSTPIVSRQSPWLSLEIAFSSSVVSVLSVIAWGSLSFCSLKIFTRFPTIGTQSIVPCKSLSWYIPLMNTCRAWYGPNHLRANFQIKLFRWSKLQSPSSIFLECNWCFLSNHFLFQIGSSHCHRNASLMSFVLPSSCCIWTANNSSWLISCFHGSICRIWLVMAMLTLCAHLGHICNLAQ